MEEARRSELVRKISEMKRLGEEVRNSVGIPAIEAFMRLADVHCNCALWFMGETDLFQYELDWEKRIG